jgi:hypothetical protein
MGNNMRVNLVEAEKQARATTIKKHYDVFELLATMLNLYTTGFGLIGTLDNKTSDTDWVWLFLITRSFFSLRCSVELMTKAYYAQAIALVRIVTEASFLCGNCEKDRTIIDALLHNKPNRPNGKTRFDYKQLATDMKASLIYEKDYIFECNYSHTSSQSLGIMTTESNGSNRELQPVPFYDEIRFITCCESAFRSGLLMAEFLERLLDDLSKEKVKAWRVTAKTGVEQIKEWLGGLKERYGSQYGHS